MKRLFIIIAAVIFAFLVFSAFKINQFYQAIYKKNTSVKKVVNKTAYTFLLLGYGGGAHEGTFLTDSMIAIHVDLKTKKVILISLPRDIWVKLPTKSGAGFHAKINSVYQLDLFPKTYPDVDISYSKKVGYSNLTSLVVSQIIGFPVDGYLAIDFSGFTRAIDFLGGVDVNVVKAFEDPEYPIDGKETDLCGKEEVFKLAEPFISPSYNNDEREKIFKEKPEVAEFVKNATESPELAFPCRYEKLSFKAGLTHMDGATALKYVRSRHGIEDGGDFGRSARQQQFILAVKNKVLNLGFVAKILPLMDQVKEEVKTDISPEIIKKFIGQAPYAKEYTIANLILSTDNYLSESTSADGQYILIPKAGENNWNQLKTSVKNIIAGITPTPAPTIKPSSLPQKSL